MCFGLIPKNKGSGGRDSRGHFLLIAMLSSSAVLLCAVLLS